MPSRCPLLGFALKSVVIEGQTIPGILLRVEKQPEIGLAGYDAGAQILTEFFHKELAHYLDNDLDPLGRKIIECCLANGSVDDYMTLLPHTVIADDL